MRRDLVLGIVAAVLLVGGAASADGGGHRRHGHHGHHGGHGHYYYGGWGPRVVIGVAPPVYWGWYPPYAPYLPYPPYPAYPVTGRDEPDAYVERPAPPAEGYWYYCESAGAYYPHVPACPEPWVKVAPRPE